jgi:basic-leucine zipper transcription factor A
MGSGYYKEFANGKYTFYKARGYSIESGYFFDSDTGISDGIYRDQNGNFFVVDSAISLDTYCDNGFTFRALRLVECASSPVGKIRNHIQGRNSTKMILDIVAQCNADEDFNTDTKQCQKCPDGQSWNPSTNSCFNDCSDLNKNKYGFTDGSCADCSGEKESFDVKKCYCNFIGSSPRLQNIELIQGDFRFTSCTDGSQFWYKIPGTPDVDNNKTKPDLKNPSPGGNGTKPDDPNNPNQGGGSQGGNQGGNNGGNQGNNTNPNPDPKPNPKPGNGNTTNTNNDGNNNGGGGNNSNGDNLKFTPDGSADKYEKDINDFAGKFKDAAGGIVGEFGNFKKGVDQLIANIEGKGIKDVKSQAIPSSCPREFTVDMFGNSYVIKIDYCKYIAPAANVLYYIFYILFFLAFLLGVYKTVLFLI